MGTPGYFLIKLSSRILDEIRENIIKRGRRNVISRHYHVKDDKEAIATWRLDLNRVWRVFNVRSVIYVWPLLTVRFQTELGIDTRATGSGARQDAANKPSIFSDVTPEVGNTRTTASDIHHTALKSRKGTGGQNQAVSTARTVSPSKYLPLLRLMLGQRSLLQLSPTFNIYIQRARRATASATWEFAWDRFKYPPRRRFGGSSRRYGHSNRGFRHSLHAEKSARCWWPTSAGECYSYCP